MSETMTIAFISASAALLGSLITSLASLGVVYAQERRRAKAAQEDEFFAAAQIVLNKGLTMIDRSRLWSGILQGHSRPSGALAVLHRLRHPVDPARVLEPLKADQEAIHFAGARVVLHADQETAALCNRVLHAANAVAVAILPGQRHGAIGRLATPVLGLPTPDPAQVRRPGLSLTLPDVHSPTLFGNETDAPPSTSLQSLRTIN